MLNWYNVKINLDYSNFGNGEELGNPKLNICCLAKSRKNLPVKENSTLLQNILRYLKLRVKILNEVSLWSESIYSIKDINVSNLVSNNYNEFVV